MIHFKRFSVFITLSLIFLLSLTNAQTAKKPFTIDDQVQLNVPSNPEISPNGNQVVFTIKKGDLTISKWITQVYLFNVKAKTYEQFTTNGASCYDAKFSPDGKWITFLSSREYLDKNDNKIESGKTQLWAAPVDGGEGLNWTYLPKSIQEYAWSNDSKKIAILTDIYNQEKVKKEAELKKKKLEVQVFPHNNPEKVLYIFDVSTKKIISSFTLDAGVEDISFNNAGDKNIYQTNYTGTYNDAQKYDIHSISLKGKKRQLTSAAGPETSPAYSPDDKHIAYITQTIPDVESAETDLDIMDANGKNSKNLTTNFNFSVDRFIWKNNNTILFTVKEGVDNQLYKINVENGKIEKLTKGNRIISSPSLSQNSNTLCYLEQSAKTLPEIFINNKRVSNFSKQLNEYIHGTQEVVNYKSRDRKFNIQGILFKPQNFDPAKKYPLILTVHGGPYGRFVNSFLQYYGVHDFNNAGYVVFAPNPRGSSGRSDAFSEAPRYDLGGSDYRDIMTGVDYIISKGFVDTTRMGVTGGSYGGYLTNWIISQNHRFKAAVSMYGMFSYFTDWGNSSQPSFEKMWFGYYYWQKPINMKNLYVSRSPAFYTQNIETPTLILHGAKDVLTDVANSREMYQVLHTRGVPVKFVIYPRAGHGLRNEPNQYLDTIHRALKWFGKYLK